MLNTSIHFAFISLLTVKYGIISLKICHFNKIKALPKYYLRKLYMKRKKIRSQAPYFLIKWSTFGQRSSKKAAKRLSSPSTNGDFTVRQPNISNYALEKSVFLSTFVNFRLVIFRNVCYNDMGGLPYG